MPDTDYQWLTYKEVTDRTQPMAVKDWLQDGHEQRAHERRRQPIRRAGRRADVHKRCATRPWPLRCKSASESQQSHSAKPDKF